MWRLARSLLTASQNRRAQRALAWQRLCWLCISLTVFCPTAYAANQTLIERGIKLGVEARDAAANNKVDRALDLNERARQTFAKAGAAKSWLVAVVLADRAELLLKARKAELAQPVLISALDLAETSSWPTWQDRYHTLVKIGSVYRSLGFAGRALPVYQSAAELFWNKLPPDQRVDIDRRLAGTLMALDRYSEAEPFSERAIEQGRGISANVEAAAVLDRAELAIARREMDRANELFDRVDTMQVDTMQVDPGGISPSLQFRSMALRAKMHVRQMKFDEARTELDNTLAALGDIDHATDPTVGVALTEISGIHILRGEYSEAIKNQANALEFYTRILGPDHPLVAQSHYLLALAYREVKDFDTSAAHFALSKDILARSVGRDSPALALPLSEEARLQSLRGAFAESLETAKRAAELVEADSEVPIYTKALVWAGLGQQLVRAEQYGEAKPYLIKALDIMRSDATPSKADMIPSLSSLAKICIWEGDLEGARRYAEQADQFADAAGSLGLQDIWQSKRILAEIALEQNRTSDAIALMQIAVDRQASRLAALSKISTYASEFETENVRSDVEMYFKAVLSSHAMPQKDFIERMFKVAQLPSASYTSQAINGISGRFSTNDAALAELIRQRQAVGVERRSVDRMLSNALISLEAAQSDDSLAILRRKLASLDDQITAIDQMLTTSYSRFVSLLEPKATTVTAIQNVLNADEALLVQLSATDATYLFLIKQGGVEFASSPIGSAELLVDVEKLRNTLDFDKGRLVPFDAETAHSIYASIFSQFEESLRGIRHLVFVPDQAMLSLPPAVLLRTPYIKAPYAPIEESGKLDYLALHLATSIMPSADAFVALRSIPDSVKFERVFVGFGNPQLPAPPKSSGGRAVDIDPNTAFSDWRSIGVHFSELPETATEIRQLANFTGADDKAVYLGSDATEVAVKEGNFASVKTVAFATHGLLANEILGLREPALVLSLPRAPTQLDDGFLTATEIASLKMDSGLVILSACNTAGRDGKPGAQGLSGLARAFFYAGAQSILVTHWSIASKATVPLTTTFIEYREKHPEERPSELLRRAEVDLIKGKFGDLLAHPSVWGSFVLVGDK